MVKQKNIKSARINIRPLMGYCLIEPSDAEVKTASGLILPESAQEKPAQGKVLSTGDPIFINGKELSSPVKIGDRVIYRKWGTEDIKIEGVEYKLVKFDDLIAVLEN